MSELPVPVGSAPEPPKSQTLVCANCGVDLGGEYCAACGQRHEPHVHTVGHFASEAFESISHADSRLWRTLWLLFSRPGFLTREFFAGRRARYLPPFRLYLVLSVVLVVLSALAAGENDPDPDATREEPAAAPSTAESASTGGSSVDAPAGAPATASPPVVDASPPGVQPRWVVNIDGLNDFCAAFDGPDDGEGNVAARQNVRRFCTRIRTTPGELAEAVVHSIPRAMFVFLPVIAALMKLMYWRPKRYYVEHLLFLVHNHAAVFLVYTLVALVSFVPVVGDFTPLFFFVALSYLAWYIHRAMRTVYGQGKWLTLGKYLLLFWIYFFTAIAGFLLTLVLIAIWG
jgi:hypothetical protein